MPLIRKVALCFVLTCCLPAILIGYDLPTASPEQVGLSAEKLAGTQAALQKLINEKRIAGGIVVVLTQHRPYSGRAENAVKPIVYEAILDGK